MFIFSYKTWNAAKPGAWLARSPAGPQQSQDFSPILSMMLQVLHSQQQSLRVTLCQGSVQPG